MPRTIQTTFIDGKLVVLGDNQTSASQGTQEAKGKKRKPRFFPRKHKKSTTSNPKVHLTMKKRKKGSENFEEEGFEEEATEKDIASKKVSELCEEEGFEVEATSIPKVHLTLKSKK